MADSATQPSTVEFPPVEMPLCPFLGQTIPHCAVLADGDAVCGVVNCRHILDAVLIRIANINPVASPVSHQAITNVAANERAGNKNAGEISRATPIHLKAVEIHRYPIGANRDAVLAAHPGNVPRQVVGPGHGDVELGRGISWCVRLVNRDPGGRDLIQRLHRLRRRARQVGKRARPRLRKSNARDGMMFS